MVAAGRPTHRVADLFCSERPGSLRLEFETFVNLDLMSTNLQTMLTAYQLCNLDDGFQESPHGIITNWARGRPRSLPSDWSAQLRYMQNIVLKRLLDRNHPGRFAALFDHWRMLFSKKPTFGVRRLLCPRHFIRKDFLKKTYRMDDYAFHRVEGVKKSQSKFLDSFSEEVKQISNTGKIVREYLRMVLCPRDIVSIISRSPPGHCVDVPVTLEEPPLIYSIISSRVNALKTIVTQSAVADASAPAPFMVNCFVTVMAADMAHDAAYGNGVDL